MPEIKKKCFDVPRLYLYSHAIGTTVEGQNTAKLSALDKQIAGVIGHGAFSGITERGDTDILVPTEQAESSDIQNDGKHIQFPSVYFDNNLN